jgi:hypothetical protein
MAYIRYTPSVDNPHADFADEVYFPPENHQEAESEFPLFIFKSHPKIFDILHIYMFWTQILTGHRQ